MLLSAANSSTRVSSLAVARSPEAPGPVSFTLLQTNAALRLTEEEKKHKRPSQGNDERFGPFPWQRQPSEPCPVVGVLLFRNVSDLLP